MSGDPHDGRGRIRVLIVDDDRAYANALMTAISDDDRLEVIGTAGDGAEALELSRRLRPDVMLLDVQMPRVNGIDTLRKLKRRKRRPAVVMLTALTDTDMLARAERSAPEAFLQKTVDATVVASTVVLVAMMDGSAAAT